MATHALVGEGPGHVPVPELGEPGPELLRRLLRRALSQHGVEPYPARHRAGEGGGQVTEDAAQPGGSIQHRFFVVTTGGGGGGKDLATERERQKRPSGVFLRQSNKKQDE